MNLIRRMLYLILGKQLYFRVVSKSFLVLYRLGILSVFKKFSTHYFVKSLICKGDNIIDIGANLGYYTCIFAKETGDSGKVFAVEPVDLYRSILEKNTRRFSNIELIPYALSSNEGESYMGINSEQEFRHGLTKIIPDAQAGGKNSYPVVTKTPGSLFSKLEKLDYIKCDIEGHEINVIPGFNKLIEKFLPVIQIEIEKANFDYINNIFTNNNYRAYTVYRGKLRELDKSGEVNSDIIYLPPGRNNLLN